MVLTKARTWRSGHVLKFVSKNAVQQLHTLSILTYGDYASVSTTWFGVSAFPLPMCEKMLTFGLVISNRKVHSVQICVMIRRHVAVSHFGIVTSSLQAIDELRADSDVTGALSRDVSVLGPGREAPAHDVIARGHRHLGESASFPIASASIAKVALLCGVARFRHVTPFLLPGVGRGDGIGGGSATARRRRRRHGHVFTRWRARSGGVADAAVQVGTDRTIKLKGACAASPVELAHCVHSAPLNG